MSRGPRAQADLRLVDAATPLAGEPDLAELRAQLHAAGMPPEFLTIVDQAPTIDAALEQLEAAGVMASAAESFADVLEEWRVLLRRETDPLSAELFGTECLAALRSTTRNEADADAAAAAMVVAAEDRPSPEALAMLRVLAVVGSADTRPAAGAAADRLAADGIKDRPWVLGLGSPKVGEAFGYADQLGAQESVVVSFRYGRRSHMLAVLIDHDLGGGVKDCFFGYDSPQSRAEHQLVAADDGAIVRDITIPEAAEILVRALAMPPCPQDPDQVEDVHTYLGLTRNRVALMGASTAAPARPLARRGSTG